MLQTMARGLPAALAALVLTLVAVSGTGIVQAESVTITITDSLDRASVTVAPGASITFENADGVRHRMRTTSGPDEFDTGNLEPGQRFTVTLTAVGTYRYRDERDDDNAAYVGQIVVSSTPATTAPGNPPPTSAPAPTTVTVSIGDRLYAPATVSVAPGGTVTWINNDDRPHTVTADDRSFDSGIMNTGDRWSRVFPLGGTFTYFCELHPDMRGSVVVGAGGGTPPTVPAPTTTAPAPPPPTAPTTTVATPTTTPGSVAPTTGSVSISDNRFTPATITVVAGGSITWTNRDAVPHTVTAVDRSFDSGILRQGGTWTRTFSSAGTFAYFCELHPEMRATVIVVPPGTPAPPPTTPPPPPVTSPPMPPVITPTPPAPTVPPGQPLPASVAVSIAGNAYQPQAVTIAVGGSVTWTNADAVPHTVTATDRSFDSGILFAGDSWTMSFPSAGTYTYFCELHPEMTATVIVTTAGAAPPPVVTGGSPTTTSGPHGTAHATTTGAATGAADSTVSDSSRLAATASAALRSAAVSMANNQFQPTTVTVGVGGEVTWTNTDTIPHTVTADDGSFDSGIMMPGDTFTRRFEAAGVVPYRCTLHPGMIGTVDVVAGSAAAPGTTGAVPSPATSSGESVAGDGSTAPSSSGTATDEIIVRVTDGEFPAVVTLTVGQTITWVNDHERPIDVIADDGSFSSGEIAPGDRFSRSFMVEGARSYRSTLRDRTEGMIVVVPGSGDAVEVVPTVAVYDAWFAPRDLVVHQGATVRWAFGGVLPHTATLADGSFDSGVVQPGAIVEVTFDELGTFDYSCIVHPSMTGTVTVVPPGEAIPDSKSGISALDGGGGASAAAQSGPRTGADGAGSTGIPLGAVPLLILGLGFGAAIGILFGVGRSAPGRAAAT